MSDLRKPTVEEWRRWQLIIEKEYKTSTASFFSRQMAKEGLQVSVKMLRDRYSIWGINDKNKRPIKNNQSRIVSVRSRHNMPRHRIAVVPFPTSEGAAGPVVVNPVGLSEDVEEIVRSTSFFEPPRIAPLQTFWTTPPGKAFQTMDPELHGLYAAVHNYHLAASERMHNPKHTSAKQEQPWYLSLTMSEL